MIEWLAMKGYGFYVWSSYGALALAIALELWLIGRRRAQALDLARLSAEEEST